MNCHRLSDSTGRPAWGLETGGELARRTKLASFETNRENCDIRQLHMAVHRTLHLNRYANSPLITMLHSSNSITQIVNLSSFFFTFRSRKSWTPILFKHHFGSIHPGSLIHRKGFRLGRRSWKCEEISTAPRVIPW